LTPIGREGYGRQQKVVGSAGFTLPVAVTGEGEQLPTLAREVVSRKSPGCCTGSHVTGAAYVMAPAAHCTVVGDTGTGKTSREAAQLAPLTSPHEHVEQSRVSANPS
jgi:hypothetical protein